ncbi:hypothetical protein CMQ_67 [Grosmannia clavigera kw1407]|uniref:Uncharacterized protein n=1 Tax=Grosmannia clavigera (strain kw1407 / UAMH 11150) TaxID=655863 RepID=F0XR54_GROCL|nr:uncharacterized protein CMQ_67 [Grosmannia clavigera kw1407]EFW99749.1 hypothetical protein CMQ_67 [Grosmannia clavigera kw1407]
MQCHWADYVKRDREQQLGNNVTGAGWADRPEAAKRKPAVIRKQAQSQADVPLPVLSSRQIELMFGPVASAALKREPA